MPRLIPSQPSVHAVYRMYASDGELLYIGCTANIEKRLRELMHYHRRWIQEVARIDLEWHPDLETGRRAETQAIKTENPRYNVIGTPRQRPLQPDGDPVRNQPRSA